MSRKKKETTALVPWQDELAEAAKRSAQAEKGGGGGLPTISFRGGVISVDDEEVDGGELDVVILQAIHENRYFGAKFDPNNTTAPKCYAFADPEEMDPDEMKPHEEASDPQSDACATCPMNEWDSSDTGRGKACKNIRKFAVIPADEAEDLEEAEVRAFTIPVTSVKNWSRYVRTLADMGRPYWSVVTRVKVSPDKKSQFKVTFSFVEQVDFESNPELFPAYKAKRKELSDILQQPYVSVREEEEPPRRASRVVKRNAVKRRRV